MSGAGGWGDLKQNPLSARIIGYTRTKGDGGRVLYTVQLRFEAQEWEMRRFYSCFEGFRNALLRSQFSALAGGLPSKHPPSLLAKRMLGGSKADASFIADRQSRLEAWLQSVLHGVGPHGVEAEQCIDDFLLAIKPGDDVKGGKVKQSRSLYHFCKRLGLPQQTYRALWRDGYTFDTLGLVSEPAWFGYKVAPETVQRIKAGLSTSKGLDQEHPGDFGPSGGLAFSPSELVP